MLRQFLENLPKMRSQRPEHLLFASLRDKDNVYLQSHLVWLNSEQWNGAATQKT